MARYYLVKYLDTYYVIDRHALTPITVILCALATPIASTNTSTLERANDIFTSYIYTSEVLRPTKPKTTTTPEA